MAAYISFQPSDFFTPKLYTGTGSEITVTGVGFQPDFTWLKDRSAIQHHQLYDSARGAGEVIYSNLINAEGTVTQQLKSWTSDGYVIGTDGSVNTNTNLYASWNWKGGTTSGLTGGTITPSAYSINTTSGFGVYHYNCTGANANIAHGLGAAPEMLITKSLGDTSPWAVWHTGIANTEYLVLNTTAAKATGAAMWNSTSPTSTLFYLGTDGQTNGTGKNNVMYAFASVKGYSKFGSYEGNGNVDGPFIYTGFRPGFVMIKNIDGVEGWDMYDIKRNPGNLTDNKLKADSSVAEEVDSTVAIDILSNGFKIRTTSTEINLSTAVYAAFAEFPLVSSNSKAGVAR